MNTEDEGKIIIDKLPEGWVFYEYLSTLELCYKGETIKGWPKSYKYDPEYSAQIMEEIKEIVKTP